jgi:hypothetical protein
MAAMGSFRGPPTFAAVSEQIEEVGAFADAITRDTARLREPQRVTFTASSVTERLARYLP